jgi:hypothetical protein
MVLKTKKLKELLAISNDMDRGKNIGIKTSSVKKLFKHLKM